MTVVRHCSALVELELRHSKFLCFVMNLSLVSVGEIRLAGSGLTREGRLEVYHDGRWGTVCHDLFDDVDASVACFQLGLG